MISSINDNLRNKINNLIVKDPDNSIVNFLEWYNIKSSEGKDTIMRLLISDFYKNIYFIKDSKIKSELLEFLENEEVNNIILCLENDYDLLIKFLYATIKFNNATFFDKQVLFKKIQNKDKILLKIYKGHILDKIIYSEKDKLEDLIFMYEDYIKKSTEKEKFKIADCFLCLNMLKIKEKDYNLYKKYILEFIKSYYKWKKFLICNKKNILSEKDIKYLNFIENSEIEDIIDITNYNKDFFQTLVGEYFYSKTIKIVEIINEMEEFINKNLDDNQKKKFKI